MIGWTSFHLTLPSGTVKKWPPTISLSRVRSHLLFGEEGFALMIGGKRVGTFEIDADADEKHDHVAVHFLIYPEEDCGEG